MYTPQFSDFDTISVRRLAWALKVSMPAAVNRMVKLLPTQFNAEQVCLACQDKSRCCNCAFFHYQSADDINALTAI